MTPRRLAAGLATICTLATCALLATDQTAIAAPTAGPSAPATSNPATPTPASSPPFVPTPHAPAQGATDSAFPPAANTPPAVGGPAGGSSIDLRPVRCPTGGSIVVSSVIAAGLAGLLEAGRVSGVPLCGQGYRDIGVQIALRRQNCGPSDDQIWREPAAACRPPTAIPGTSRHEQGLAVDLTTPNPLGYFWLAANAPRFGLHPLADGSEPWHISIDGR